MAAPSTKPDTPRNRGDLSAPHVSPVTPEEDARTIAINRVSWGAVLAGTMMALVTHVILNMIGVGVGAASLEPLTSDNPSASALSIGAAIWVVLSGIVAALVGGFTAGRLAGKPKENTAGWHGLTAWAVSTLLIVVLLTTAMGNMVGAAYRGMTNALGSVASTTAQVAAPALGRVDPFASIEQAVRTRGDDPTAAREAAVAAVRALVTGDPQLAQQARDRATEAIAKAQNISADEARGQVQQYEQQYRQRIEETKAKAAEVADKAAKAVSRAALLGAISLILGAVAAWFAGRMGTVDPTITVADYP